MISASNIPEEALHLKYRNEGGYADCYTAEVEKFVDLAGFVAAFYTSPLFKLERFILAHIISKPSTDKNLEELLSGQSNLFAAWTQECRTQDQLLMKDYQGMTLSWFMVKGQGPCRLYFGSAIVRVHNATKRKTNNIPILFRVTLWFHKLYSRALMWSAIRNLKTRNA